MSKEIIKLNSAKKFNQIAKKEKTPPPVVEQPLWEDKVAAFIENKIGGAVKEISRRKELDENVENSLSDGLEINPEFVKQSKKIDKKRNWLLSKIESLFKKKGKKEAQPYVFDEAAEKAMRELEQELTDGFAKDVYGRLGEMNKRILLDHLVDNPVNRTSSKIIELPTVSEANNNVYAFSDNGYLMQLANKEEVRDGQNIKVNSEEAVYNLIAPDGHIISQNLKYQEALDDMEVEANLYQEQLNEEFARQEIVNKNLADREKELSRAEIEQVNEKEVEMNKMMDDFLEDEKDIVLQAQKEQEFSAHPEKWSEELEKNEAENNQEEKPELIILPEAVNDIELVKENLINEKISKYAESIGIKAEELTANPEFLQLSPEQQQFALETLRRSSLAKAKVEGHQNFIKEKVSKKWWQVGFVMNQNYHKERHKIEAVKDIEARGLEGYGQNELTWLVGVIKDGPEIKINEQGEVLVDFLKESDFPDFDDEKKAMLANYNELARDYIEYKPQKNKPDARGEMASKMDEIYRKIFNSANYRDEQQKIGELFLKSHNNIELLRFLSADKETEETLNRLASSQTTGLDKLKGLISSNKDKAGYSALGFALRTGSKFALANSAYLASALSYSVAPMAAAIVGGFRGYNNAKKDLLDKNSLANLGIEDQSGLVRAKNSAVGHKENENGVVNFGLKEKLADSIAKLKSSNSTEEWEKNKERLLVRVNYTQLKINREEIDFGSIEERNSNYLELINTLAEAKTVIGVENFRNLNRQRKYIFGGWELNENQKKDLELRLNSFLKFQENKQTKKEEKFLIKKAATGALMGASFAAIGAFVAEHLQVSDWFSGDKKAIDKDVLVASLKIDASDNEVIDNSADINTESAPVDEVVETTPDPVIEKPTNISDTKVDHISDPRENLVVEKIEVKPIGVKPVEIPNKIIETENNINLKNQPSDLTINNQATPEQEIITDTTIKPETIITETNTAIDNSVVSENVVDQEVIDGRAAAAAVKESINYDNKAAELADKLYSNNSSFRTEEGFLNKVAEINNIKITDTEKAELQSIFKSFKNNNDYNILRRRLVMFENNLANRPNVEALNVNGGGFENVNTTTTPEQEIITDTTIKPETIITETNTAIDNSVVSENVVDQEVIDGRAAAAAVKESINYDNKAAELADKLYSNNSSFRTEEGFLNKVAEINNIKITDTEKAELQSIFKSFKNNNDYNILRRRLVMFENNLANRPNVEVVTDNINKVTEVSSELAKEFHVKPESINQIGDNIFYSGEGKSNLVIDLKSGVIKEAVDAKGNKVPEEFIKDLMGKKNINKFSRNDGFDKIFSSWDKLSSDDRLIYNSLNWFNKKTMSPEDLINQVKGLYQVDTKNISVDSLNKKFISSDGREFDLNLKGVKKMVSYLKRS